MNKFLKTVAGAMALVTLAASLAGCSGLSKKKKMPEKQVLDHVYKYTDKEIITVTQKNPKNQEEFEGYTYLNNINLDPHGYTVSIVKNDKNYNTESMSLIVGDFDGNQTTIDISDIVKGGENIYRSMGSVVPYNDGYFLYVDGNELVDKDNYIYKSTSELYFYDKSGNPGKTIDLRKAFNIADDKWSNFSYFTVIGDIIYTAYSTEDSRDTVAAITLDGKVEKEIKIIPDGKDGYLSSLFGAGDLLYVAYETYTDADYSLNFTTVNAKTGERKDYDLGRDNYDVMYNSFVGEDGSLYISSDTSLDKFDLNTFEREVVINYLNSDYKNNDSRFCALPDGRFACLDTEYTSTEDAFGYESKNKVVLNVFSEVPASELTPKYIITVASAGYTYGMLDQMIEFNRSSDEYRMKYVDYTVYNTSEDYNAGKTKLNDDIIQGNIPDILIADQEFSTAKYYNKGIFADMYTFMDADEKFNRSVFLENVLKAFETDGKLIELPTNFYVYGIAGLKDKITDYDKCTIREFLNKAKALPDGVKFFRDGEMIRDNVLEILFSVNYGSFVDTVNGKASFNNDEFKAMLELAATFPEKYAYDGNDSFDWDAYDNMFKEGKAIGTISSLSSFDNLINYYYEFGDGEIAFMGFPSPDKNGLAMSTANLKFLISEKSSFKDQAWNFVKIFFEDEHQTENNWAFPVTKTAFEAMKQKTIDSINERNDDGYYYDGDYYGTAAAVDVVSEAVDTAEAVAVDAVAVDAVEELPDAKVAVATTVDIAIEEPVTGGIIGMPNPYSNRPKLTKESIDQVTDYILSTNKQVVLDQSILDIVQEVASEYFSGQKSLDNLLPQLENRVNIVLSESR